MSILSCDQDSMSAIALQSESSISYSTLLYIFFRYYGSYNFTIPSLILKDPELVKQITVKDFDHFVDHNTFLSEEVDPLWGKNLFALTGNEISN
jgi:hypothetical protein